MIAFSKCCSLEKQNWHNQFKDNRKHPARYKTKLVLTIRKAAVMFWLI